MIDHYFLQEILFSLWLKIQHIFSYLLSYTFLTIFFLIFLQNFHVLLSGFYSGLFFIHFKYVAWVISSIPVLSTIIYRLMTHPHFQSPEPQVCLPSASAITHLSVSQVPNTQCLRLNLSCFLPPYHSSAIPIANAPTTQAVVQGKNKKQQKQKLRPKPPNQTQNQTKPR